MKPLLIGIIGSKNTGKSTFTVACSNSLFLLGKKVAIIKFSHSHYSFEPDTKDSAIFHETSAKNIIFTSPYETVLYKKTSKRLTLKKLKKFISNDIDIILCESYPSNFPVIPSIFTIKSKTDYNETKMRYSAFKPFFITGIYTDTHTGILDGVPILRITNKDDESKITKLILNQDDSELIKV
ncbi:MAG: molybdopterin-guanine dinucleotide biosynthesis protein MobB [Candidatus Heimdallarchaeota archaeon]|nr:molybdopterin-guanine dinucleotide biosynthesis protein MobB [Candidatus Heimdallarchaeota archaeon]